jgi:hypothetical protein
MGGKVDVDESCFGENRNVNSLQISGKHRKINEIYKKIAGVIDPKTKITQPGTGIVEPGDLLFSISHYPYESLKDEVNRNDWRKKFRTWMKPWQGFDRNDFDVWHVAIYIGARKRKHHNKVNIWMIHSTGEEGVHIKQISHGIFKNKSPEERTRVELLKYKYINKQQREKIVDFANSKVGFEYNRRMGKYLTYVFGLPNAGQVQNQFTCQQLAIEAYAAAGIYFPHPYKSFPMFNIGRYLGHPLGHPKDGVDPRYPYLMDHHIYRDPRFVLRGAVYQDPNTYEILLQTENLKKYSWNESLREKYIKKGYLDP